MPWTAVQENPTSLSLLDRVRGRDQEAWQRLLYLYGPLVYFWCQKWGVQGADADDIRQDVFLTVATRLESFRRDRPGDTFRGWLRVITHRKILDQHRLRKGRPEATGSDVDWLVQVAPKPLPDDDDPAEEVSRLLHRGLELVRSEFEARTWQAFWRCTVDGRLAADVAEEMGMKPAAVRKAKSRVLSRLREELGELWEDA